MKALLDTHAFLWWTGDPEKLSPAARVACEDSGTDLILSVVSLWEIQIKAQLGKLTLARPLREIVEIQQQINRVHMLPVTLEHVLALDRLPLHHKDPFDRLLITQAVTEDASLISTDQAFKPYSVNLLW